MTSTNRTVFITGAARGIGSAIAAELRARGYRVLAPTRDELNLERADAIEAWFEANRTGPIDILINNAGINVLRPIAEITPLDWHRMMQVNVSATLRLTQLLIPGMIERRWGRVLNISSIFGKVTKERRAAYSATKAALDALTRSAAVELGPSGILVNALAPGYVDTDLTRKNNSQADLEHLCHAIPLRRLADAGELARVAAFLVSDDNTYLTGQTLVVDGGFTCL